MSGISLVVWSAVIEDPDSSLHLKDILAQDIDGLPAYAHDVASFGFSDAAYWFVLDLHNPHDTPLQRLLVFEPTWLDEVEVYLVAEDGRFTGFKGGDTLAFTERAVANHKINFRLNLPAGTTRLVVRTHTVDPYHVGMTFFDVEDFFKGQNTQQLYLGILYGAVIAMLLYNLILYLSVRERVYAAYIAYLFFFLLMHATYNGYTFPHLWPDSPLWGNWAHSIFIYIFLASGLFFATTFLQLKQKQAHAYNWVLKFSLLLVASFVLSAVLGGYSLQVRSSIIWVMVYAPFVLVLALVALKSGNRAARFFLTAAFAGFVGSFITAMAVAGVIAYTDLTYHAVDVGMLVDAILLSFALADRLRIARLQTEQARSDLLAATNSYALQLDQTVNQRTLDLRNANATKDKFFSIIAHDLRGPIGGLTSLFEEVIVKPEDFTADDLAMTRESIHNTSQLLEQLLSWARSQRGEITVTPQSIDINALLIETQALFNSQAVNKGIYLDLMLEGHHYVHADISMVRTILRNLTSNALKFTHKHGSVYATIEQDASAYIISILDNGLGINDEVQKSLFRIDSRTHSTAGTDGESGSGLGLILCAEFVARNNGQIGVVSNLHAGSRFWFSLPRAEHP